MRIPPQIFKEWKRVEHNLNRPDNRDGGNPVIFIWAWDGVIFKSFFGGLVFMGMISLFWEISVEGFLWMIGFFHDILRWRWEFWVGWGWRDKDGYLEWGVFLGGFRVCGLVGGMVDGID